ncbi:MAG: T9SS type A sorting domain-containing protein [Ignavibacteriaceae bacterium]|nr:T9SS type A sorting domain-containing protein [Ignavibacteriaceae bacterium]
MKHSFSILILSLIFIFISTGTGQDKPDGLVFKTSLPENPVVSIKNDVLNRDAVSNPKEYKSNSVSNPKLTQLNKDVFGIDAIQTTIASEDYYFISHTVVTEQTGNSAGTLWVIAGIQSSPQGNDKIGIYKYEQTGWVLKTYIYTFRFLANDIDAEIIERSNGDKFLWMTCAASQTFYGKKNVLIIGLNLFNLNQGSLTELSWPGGTGNEYYNPHITTDNGVDETNPWIYLVASVDSITTDNKHVNAQKFAYVDNPWEVTSPSIKYRAAILPVFWPAGGTAEIHYLYSDIAYVHVPSTLNRIIFTYSNVPDQTKIWLSSCTIIGSDAMFTGTVDRGTNNKIRNSAIAASGGLDQSQIMIAFEENYNNSGDIDIHSARSDDGGITWSSAGIDFSVSNAMLGKLVSRRGITNEYYLSYFSNIDSVMSVKSNSNQGHYWDSPIKVNDSYPSNPFYLTSTGFTNTSGERLTVWGKFAQALQLPVLLIGSFWPQLPSPVEDNTEINLSSYQLFQNYPNPFNPATIISYQLPSSNNVTLKIYDVLGNEVARLVDEYKTAGSYEAKFDASRLSSGVYLYTLRAGEFIRTKKMILIK